MGNNFDCDKFILDNYHTIVNMFVPKMQAVGLQEQPIKIVTDSKNTIILMIKYNSSTGKTWLVRNILETDFGKESIIKVVKKSSAIYVETNKEAGVEMDTLNRIKFDSSNAIRIEEKDLRSL